MIALVALVDAAILYNFWQQRRTPLLRVTPVEIEIFASTHSRAGKMLTHEAASWATTQALLVLRSARGEELQIPLAALSKADARRLMALVRGLALASSPGASLSARDVQRVQLRRMALALGIVVVTVAVTLWILLRPIG
jgi:hypothetical protein